MALNDIPLTGNIVFHMAMFPSVRRRNTCATQDKNIDVLLEKWLEQTDKLSNIEHVRRLKAGSRWATKLNKLSDVCTTDINDEQISFNSLRIA